MFGTTLGATTKIVGPDDVRVVPARGSAYAVRDLSEKGAGPERRYLDGKRVKVNRTSLGDPGDGSQVVDAGDGKIWILESEPA